MRLVSLAHPHVSNLAGVSFGDQALLDDFTADSCTHIHLIDSRLLNRRLSCACVAHDLVNGRLQILEVVLKLFWRVKRVLVVLIGHVAHANSPGS